MPTAWPSELPSYPKYPGRAVQVLTGDWDFGFSASYSPENTTSLDGLAFDRTQAVPAAWDAAYGTGLQYSRGVGAYRTNVEMPAGAAALLHFEACSMFCRVYVDGVLLHNHTLGGFTPFWVEVPQSNGTTTRSLVVVSSNHFSKQLTPTQRQNYDFYQFGGLIRTVSLHVLPAGGAPSLDRVEVTPLAAPPAHTVPSGHVNVSVVLRGAPAAGAALVLELCWDGRAAAAAAASTHVVQPGGILRLDGVQAPRGRLCLTSSTITSSACP